MLRSSAALTITLAAHTALACPPQAIVDVPITPTGATIRGNGGVLVGMVGGGGGRGGSVTLRSGKNTVEIEEDYLAPNLKLLKPAKPLARTLQVDDGSGQPRTYQEQLDGTPLGAPVGTVTSTLPGTSTPRPMVPGIPNATMTITLSADAPADAAALVLRSTKDGMGLLWTPVTKGQRTFTIVAGGKGCVPGPHPARQGQQVDLMWVDVYGQKSAIGKPIVVGAPSVPKPVKATPPGKR